MQNAKKRPWNAARQLSSGVGGWGCKKIGPVRKIHASPIFSQINNCNNFLEIIFHGSYMRIIPQHVSGHVRDTCMKVLGINKCKCYMLVTCRKCFRINNVSFSSTMIF